METVEEKREALISDKKEKLKVRRSFRFVCVEVFLITLLLRRPTEPTAGNREDPGTVGEAAGRGARGHRGEAQVSRPQPGREHQEEAGATEGARKC